MIKVVFAQHVKNISMNPFKYSHDLNRAINHFAKRIRSGKGRNKVEVSQKIVKMVFNAQGNVPLFHVAEEQMCWNEPWDFGLNYIKFYYGHIKSRSNGGDISPKNFVFESAQCNRQHGAYDIDKWVKHLNRPEITNRFNKVLDLHNTKEFNQLIEELNK